MIGTKGAWRVNADCYLNLANAVVLQAVEDYKVSLKMDRNKQKYNYDPFFHKETLEHFFLSDWFMLLTNVNGKVLIDTIQKEELR